MAAEVYRLRQARGPVRQARMHLHNTMAAMAAHLMITPEAAAEILREGFLGWFEDVTADASADPNLAARRFCQDLLSAGAAAARRLSDDTQDSLDLRPAARSSSAAVAQAKETAR